MTMSKSELPESYPQHDHSDIASIQRQLQEACDELSHMVDAVAKARQIKEWDGERRKAALSVQVAPLLADNSAAAAEHKARASEAYHGAMAALSTDLYAAEKAILRYETTRIKWESARSLLSLARTITERI